MRKGNILKGIKVRTLPLTGIPLLKFSSDSGARAVEHILADPGFSPGEEEVLDLIDVKSEFGLVPAMVFAEWKAYF